MQHHSPEEFQKELAALRAEAHAQTNPAQREALLEYLEKMESFDRDFQVRVDILKRQFDAADDPRCFSRKSLLQVAAVLAISTVMVVTAQLMGWNRQESGKFFFFLLIPVGAVLLISAYRLKRRVKAREEMREEFPGAPGSEPGKQDG